MGNCLGNGGNRWLKSNNSVRRQKKQMEPQRIQEIMDNKPEKYTNTRRRTEDEDAMENVPLLNHEIMIDETEGCTDTRHLTEDTKAMEKECLLNLDERLSHHKHVIEGLARLIESQKGIYGLLHPDITNESANEASRSADYHSKRMSDSADALEQMRKPYGPFDKVLKESFRDLYGAINNCLEQFGKKDLFTCIQDEKHVTGKHIDVRKDDGTQRRNMEDKMKRQQQMVDEKDKQNSKLKCEIKQNKPINAKVHLQLFHKHEGNTIKEIEEGIRTILVNKLGAIDFTICKKASEIDDEKLLIVPCIVTSRVAADAENAIKDISNPGNTTLLLIHNKEAHALGYINSSLTLNDRKFKELSGIIDLAFTTGNGFYHCDINSRGIDSLCSCCTPTTHIGVRL